MTTFNFVATHTNAGNDPRRAEQLRLASEIDLDQIKVDHMAGPIGGHGFRKGYWTVEYDGKKWRFFASVSHYADLDQQANMIRKDAALYIAGVRSGYVAENQINHPNR